MHTHTHAHICMHMLEQEKEASLSSLQKASQLTTNCLALMSRTFLSANEAGGRRRERECVCVTLCSARCVCVCFWKIESGETEQRSNGVRSAAHFQRAVWHSLEGMRGWITLLAATVTFQWGSTLSSPLSNPRWNDHLCEMRMRPEIKWPACFLELRELTRDVKD